MDPDAVRQWQRAEQLCAEGSVPPARILYEKLAGDPTFAPLSLLRLSLLDREAGDIRGATENALAAADASYPDPDLMELLCKALLTLGETRRALACAEALGRMPATREACAEVGKLLSDHMLPDAALPLLGKAIQGGLGNSPHVRYLVGLNQMYAGRLDAARDELELAVRGNPGLAGAHWALAKLGLADRRGQRIDRLRKLVAGRLDNDRDAPLLWYSLFHELDNDDRVDDAWLALHEAMRRRRAQVPYQEAGQDALFDAASRALGRVSDGSRVPGPDAGPSPVFVVGLPRTGTTVIEQRLCVHADATSAGELRDLAIQMRWLAELPGSYSLDRPLMEALECVPLEGLGARYLSHTRWRARGSACFVDKWPENYLAVGHILAALPEARVVCVRRAAADACFSNLKEWFAASYLYSYDMREVARHYARFSRLLGTIEAMGHPRVAFVDYEDFVGQPDSVVGGIVATLGLPARKQAPGPRVASIATASTIQARGPVTRRRIGAWRRYRKYLGPMLDELARGGHPVAQDE